MDVVWDSCRFYSSSMAVTAPLYDIELLLLLLIESVADPDGVIVRKHEYCSLGDFILKLRLTFLVNRQELMQSGLGQLMQTAIRHERGEKFMKQLGVCRMSSHV